MAGGSRNLQNSRDLNPVFRSIAPQHLHNGPKPGRATCGRGLPAKLSETSAAMLERDITPKKVGQLGLLSRLFSS
jgi:hypothetical protein